jgi:hypothetical protein
MTAYLCKIILVLARKKIGNRSLKIYLLSVNFLRYKCKRAPTYCFTAPKNSIWAMGMLHMRLINTRSVYI